MTPPSDEKRDLSVCPGCGGYTDNGHDREVPPTVYYCKQCTAKQTGQVAEFEYEMNRAAGGDRGEGDTDGPN